MAKRPIGLSTVHRALNIVHRALNTVHRALNTEHRAPCTYHQTASRHRNSMAEAVRISRSVSRPMPPMTMRPANDHDAF
jgi:hypothetical protein